MLLRTDKIWLDPTRAREDYGNMGELIGLLEEHGQLLPIIVQPSSNPAFEWELDDGGRRLKAISIISAKALGNPEYKEKVEQAGITLFHIRAEVKESLTGFRKKIREYVANGGRENFNFKERAKLIREVHEGYMAEDPEWSVKKTGALFSYNEDTVKQYLNLTEKPEVFNSPQIQAAKSLRVAVKQHKIVESNTKRKLIADYVAQKEAETPAEEKIDYVELARRIVHQGDCREWIRTIPDESLSWVHWDPPFGTREGSGGAFPSYNGVSIDPHYCFQLMRDMLPQIHRVLKPTGWLAIWCSHRTTERVGDMLRGHIWDFDNGMSLCRHCGINRDSLDRLEKDYYCEGNPTAFWTNPFLNFWRKTGVGNDGHEITRFLKKDTEPFYFAAKSLEPVLPLTNRGNVFDADLPLVRRHVNHKPEGLLRQILDVISVSGEVGADASAGSGSIIEATFNSGRRGIFAELVDSNWTNCVVAAAKAFEERQIRNTAFDPRQKANA